jgi:hypothetical protein
MSIRAEHFRYVGLDVSPTGLVGHYELDDRSFSERVDFEGVDDLTGPGVRSAAQLWYLIAGLSYYKAGAARTIDLGATPLGDAGRSLVHAAVHDGLGEFAYCNDLPLDDVRIVGGGDIVHLDVALDPARVLVPFGGGIDSVVSVEELPAGLDESLFVVSPASGRFDALEATAAVSGRAIVRATRTLDAELLRADNRFFNGHVPVTAMVTLLASVAALASGRGGVVMSNEHSSSAPNLRWHDRAVNHQWSKSWAAEVLISDALAERVGDQLVVASLLRDRSELWVAQRFSHLSAYHHVFRSCNRAFTQDRDQREVTWCGECDKCLFINLVLAPFVERNELRSIFAGEPLSDPRRLEQLRALVGIGLEHKPFECVGDPDESAAALVRVSQMPEWSDVTALGDIARSTSAGRDFDELLTPQGSRRVPANWLR